MEEEEEDDDEDAIVGSQTVQPIGGGGSSSCCSGGWWVAVVVVIVRVRRRGWSSSHNVSEKIHPDNPVSKMATTGRDKEAAGMSIVTVLGPDNAAAATVHSKY